MDDTMSFTFVREQVQLLLRPRNHNPKETDMFRCPFCGEKYCNGQCGK